MNFSTLFALVVKNWKTTLGGVLTVTLTTTAALLAYPPIAANPKWVLLGGGIQAVAKVWVSMLQQDAGTVIANVPGQSNPQVVPSHETPNDPAAKPVV